MDKPFTRFIYPQGRCRRVPQRWAGSEAESGIGWCSDLRFALLATNSTTMIPGDPNWQMTILFLLSAVIAVLSMKVVALLLPVTVAVDPGHWFWIFPAPASLERLRPLVDIRAVLIRTLLLFGGVVLGCWLYWRLVDALQLRGIVRSYLAAPILLLMMETVVALVSILWLPSGRALPLVHNAPWRARSVADFWGNRWNVCFSDWARFAIFQRLRHRPALALVAAFAVSGLLHEAVINLPLYLVTGRVLFGTMMMYFLIQAIGVLVERRFRDRPALARVFAWLIFLGPAPLVLNEGLLRTMHLWPGAS
jgi:hypothetical protein